MYRSKYVTLTTDETYDHTAEAYEAGARLLGDKLNEMSSDSNIEVTSVTSIKLDVVPVRSTETFWDHTEHAIMKYKGQLTALILMKIGEKK